MEHRPELSSANISKGTLLMLGAGACCNDALDGFVNTSRPETMAELLKDFSLVDSESSLLKRILNRNLTSELVFQLMCFNYSQKTVSFNLIRFSSHPTEIN